MDHGRRWDAIVMSESMPTLDEVGDWMNKREYGKSAFASIASKSSPASTIPVRLDAIVESVFSTLLVAHVSPSLCLGDDDHVNLGSNQLTVAFSLCIGFANSRAATPVKVEVSVIAKPVSLTSVVLVLCPLGVAAAAERD